MKFALRRKARPTPEAVAAVRAAAESHRRALADAGYQFDAARESAQVQHTIARHNEANHYGDWLAGVMLNRGAA